MGFVSENANDVFISYAHADNTLGEKGKSGWIDLFEDFLRKRVRVRLGVEIDIFRDPQLSRFGGVNDQLADRIAASAVFICILSPSYINSQWCPWELEQFIRRAETSRIIKVVKTPFDAWELIPEKKNLLDQTVPLLETRFYDEDPSLKTVVDLQPEIFPEHVGEFFKKVIAIAENLVELLKQLRGPRPAPLAGAATTYAAQTIAVPGEHQIAVYLAETTKDLAKERDLVRSELVQFNYRVLPEQPLPQDSEELAAAVRNHLQQARLSIHLVGTSYGTILDGEDRSTPHVQYDLATELSQQGQLKQIVWLPPDLAPSGKQQEFVTNLRNHSRDHLQTKLEDLKTVIQKKLQPDAPNLWDDETDDLLNLCLVCHEEDAEVVKLLFSHLTFNAPFNVKALKDAASLQDHKQLLQTSDAVLMYYGHAGQDWFVPIWRQVKKHSVAGRVKPILARAIYTGQPPTPEKDLLEFDDPLVIKSYESPTPSVLASVLAPFMERIRLAIAKGGTR